MEYPPTPRVGGVSVVDASAGALHYLSEPLWPRGVEAAVLAAQCTQATLLDKEVEVFGGEVGGALTQLLHL